MLLFKIRMIAKTQQIYCYVKRGVKHQNAPYLSTVNVQKLKLRKDIMSRLCHKPYTSIYKQTLLLIVFHD